MRKIYSFVLAFVACILATNIYAAISITINIDDINRVTVGQYNSSSWDYEAIAGLKSGANTLTFDDGFSTTLKVLVTNSSEYGVESVSYVQGTNKGTIDIQYGAYLTIGDSWNGAVFTIKSFSFDDLRTASCKIYVDDASKVSVTRSSYAGIELVNGLNVVKFIPDGSNKETPFSIRGTGTLYKVKLNGEEQEASWSSYSIEPANGDSITILANFPDVNVPVHFVAADEASKGFITEVTVDGVTITNWADDNFTVKLGSTVGYKGNTTDYACDSIVTDGTCNKYFYGSSSFFAGNEAGHTVKYYAHKYASYNITINIDNPAAVTAYKYNSEYFSSYSVTAVPLVAGENVVAFNEQAKYLFIKTSAGSQVLTFTDNAGTDLTAKVDGSYPKGIATTADAVYTITTKTVERNAQIAVYIDDPTKPQYGGGLTLAANNYSNSTTPLVWQNATGASVLAQSGYNIVKFDPEFDNPAQISFYGPEAKDIHFYINNVKQDESTSFSGITLADGDVLKAFLVAEPQIYTVAFAAKEGSNYGFADVVCDVIVPVEDVSAPLSVLTDTKISFKLTGTTQVTANDKALAADEGGVYTLSINENTTILAGGEATAIENIHPALNNNVYSLQGVLLLQDATEAEIKALPAGMYIINGKTSYLLQH